jgi:hypothetical protein
MRKAHAVAALFGLGFAASLAAGDEASGHPGAFAPGANSRLCVEPSTPCAAETLVAGANADATISLSSLNIEMLPGTVVSFIPPAASLPGPETNGQCTDSLDNDGDGYANEGCLPFGYDLESNRCDNSANDDVADDGPFGSVGINDGCPQVGSSAETGSQCQNASNDDTLDDSKVNDGCVPGGVGTTQGETNALCDDATNEDPRDDAAGGAQRVNDGCPAIGPAETACDNAVDDDGDTQVNDGCPMIGGVEPEVNECLNAVDDDADGMVNDGCPEPALTSPPVGAVAGKIVTSPTTLGLINTPCNTPLSVTLGLYNSTTQNALWNEWGMGDPHPYGALGSFRDDGNGNFLPRHVERYPEFLNQMFDPDRVGDINGDGDHFDTSAEGVAENPGASPLDWYGTVEPLRPIARYSASTVVSSQALLLQVVVFAPGAFAAYKPPHPLSDLASPTLGYPAVVVIQAPTENPIPEPITDTCSPSSLKVILWGVTRDNPCTGGTCPTSDDFCINGEFGGQCPLVDPPVGSCLAPSTHEGNCVRYANPSTAGTQYFGVFQQSTRDLDGDGHENGIDTCPANTNWENPRSSSGADGDMIDSACDPNAFVNEHSGNIDQDNHPNGAAWFNAGDNCPLVSNPDNKESERDQPHSVAAPRGGSRLDAMGDACEPAETACGAAAVDDDGDGLVNDGCTTVGTPTAETNCAYSTTAEMDNDFDGYPNDGCAAVGAAESGIGCENYVSEDDDNGDTVIDASDSTNDGCPAQGGPERGCLNSTDDDGDGSVNDGCPSSSKVATGHYHTVWGLIPKCIGGVDVDGDGYCASGSATVPADPNDTNANLVPETYSQLRAFPVAHSGSGTNPPASREPVQVCNDGLDNDGDTLIDLLDGASTSGSTTDDCRPPDSLYTSGVDTDGDGSRDEAEIHLGTDPLSRCGRGLETGTTPSIGWPMDLRGDTSFTSDKVNASDLATFTAQGREGTAPGDANFDRRWDLRPGSTFPPYWINVADLNALSTNTPVPMFGVKAFGFFSVCSAHRVYGD